MVIVQPAPNSVRTQILGQINAGALNEKKRNFIFTRRFSLHHALTPGSVSSWSDIAAQDGPRVDRWIKSVCFFKRVFYTKNQ
jgi:hypothetical protein